MSEPDSGSCCGDGCGLALAVTLEYLKGWKLHFKDVLAGLSVSHLWPFYNSALSVSKLCNHPSVHPSLYVSSEIFLVTIGVEYLQYDADKLHKNMRLS